MDTAESDMADARKRSQAKGGTSGDESARMYDESGGQMLEQYSTCLDCELDDTVDIDQKVWVRSSAQSCSRLILCSTIVSKLKQSWKSTSRVIFTAAFAVLCARPSKHSKPIPR